MAPNQQTAAATAIKTTAGPKPMSAKTIAILKTTAPVVKEHGTEITSTMYGTMFSEFSEVQNLFNMSHHPVAGATKGGAPPGVSRQATALANAVIGFAANCDQLGNLGDAVPRMVHKHVSLDIRAKHYPIVGRCLLRCSADPSSMGTGPLKLVRPGADKELPGHAEAGVLAWR
ncbi:hypothetical protein PInf_020054 [Phytophthora infestans]|nr:hypothetical protein PInf_020054 [Phytophthora infestans]